MSSYNAGLKTSQTFSVSVFQTGKSYIDVNLRSDLFGNDQSDLYLCGVESLQCPLGATRLFDETNSGNAVLMTLRRRLRGALPTAANTRLHGADNGAGGVVQLAPANQHWTEVLGTLRTDASPIREIGDLFELLNRYSIKINNSFSHSTGAGAGGGGLTGNDFTDLWNVHGLNDATKTFQHFYLRMTPSGVFEFVASDLFWNNFYFEVSEYGQQVFGLAPVVGLTVANRVTAAVQSSAAALLAANGTIVTSEARNVHTAVDDYAGLHFRAVGKVSCWEALDTRLSVALATQMPLQRNIIISDEVESRSYFLGNWSLDQEFKIVNEVQDTIRSRFQISTQARSGSVVLKSSETPIVEWLHLNPATMVRNIRLSLKIRERHFRNGKWFIAVRDMPMDEHASWNAKLVFAKKL